MLCICVVRVDIWQRFETVEDVVKHFHLNPIDLVLTDGAKKRSDTFRVMLKYRASWSEQLFTTLNAVLSLGFIQRNARHTRNAT